MTSKKYRIYLAGPISGCNEKQIHEWRNHLKERYSNKFSFIDPAEKLFSRVNTDNYAPYQIARDDFESIKNADAVLVNMWKESIGSAIGVVHAKKFGKPVVVVDSNHIQSTTLAFYADAVFNSVNAAMDQIKEFLELDTLCQVIAKKNSRGTDSFDRSKLIGSIRSACQAAGKNDILVPVRLMPEVYKNIYKKRKDQHGSVFTTTNIREAVFEALVIMENDPLYGSDFSGVSEAWKRYDEQHNRKLHILKPAHEEPIANDPLAIPISTAKSHTSIWGHKISRLSDIPEEARKLFTKIACVRGIASIRLGIMSAGPKHVAAPYMEITISKTPLIIEGVCYDNGKKGNAQSFQILLHEDSKKDEIKQNIMDQLEK
ncbi:DUF4406 domain-containing protein [Trichlorobacter lovleyi]|uniref:DUF4406 domain-containing protein n=1 Tax=Trichlorobacter lovleyi TaxID=313985 RepID=UPI0024812F4C|nr:DUF4406 domain-containing protein [Trichlorobacter lovleyi]